MRVEDVMSKGIKTVSPGDAAELAWESMRSKGTHHVIVREGSRLVGVFSHRDAGGARGASLRKGRTVADLMTHGVVTAPVETTLRRAANVTRGRSIGCSIVTDRSRPVGIVTVSDLLAAVGRGVDRPVSPAPRRALSHRVPHRKQRGAVRAW